MNDIEDYRKRAIDLVGRWAEKNIFDNEIEVDAHISAENMLNGWWIAYLVTEPEEGMLYQVCVQINTNKMTCEVYGTTRPFNDLIEEVR
jgi:hypothetical protein